MSSVSNCDIGIAKSHGLLREVLKDKENFRKIVYSNYTDEMLQLNLV